MSEFHVCILKWIPTRVKFSLIVLYTFYCLVSFPLLSFFLRNNFLKTIWSIIIKVSDLIQHQICKKKTNDQLFSPHFRSRDIKEFIYLLVHVFSQKVLKKIQIFRNCRESSTAVSLSYPNVRNNLLLSSEENE